ncbi:hypothetical protein D3C86_1764960 [compost metagenome]
MEFHDLARQGAQLRQGAREIAGFADGLAIHCRDLVRSDHDAAGMAGGHHHGFGHGQAQRQGRGQFAGLWRFVYIGGNRRKGQAQARQQFFAVTRAGREDQARLQGHAVFDGDT